mmetsp:Transcript_22105/g.48087  ORF Transcript_22105/g.48087 Transcript_22105/m.48087 type:complete len:475 (+) Transcript_22105:274-1698(+)|eukprot:CAMPEP_0172317332 /NCGR_PEP_ID=MMETSP1058-20130122/31269_1 /TAXON_ID=83371 /ORGANISM="Detonula confervacea, Strain CCMP 353" /LENGTH=474 /DNA_ID=CAMNT_0013031857 /DNA_START=222 /DNA_END=1646 /DNA_ORIENTATION=+
MITKHNHRRLLFALAFITINILLLPSRIKSGFDLQRDNATGADAGLYNDNRSTIKIGTTWTDTYSPRHLKEKNVRISFRLHDPKDVPPPDKFLSVDTFFCKDRADLPPSLGPSDKGRMFDFTTTISTNLNVLFMGDSLGHQFSQGFEAAALGKGYEDKRKVHFKYHVGSKQFDCLVSSAPIRGGGVTAFWRYTKLLERSRRVPRMPCHIIERKWGENFLRTLLDFQYSDPTPGASQQGYSVSGFDAVVVRLPHGWMKAEELTKERIEEVVIFCEEMLGARAVIFTTVGLDNNAITSELWDKVTKINEIIHDVARSWEPPSDGEDGVRWILVQEFSNFTSQILYENGKHLGYDVSSNDFFFERLKGGTTSWAQSIPMVCSNKPKDDLESECKRNKISPDGIHWCVETLGPRFTASIACLLGCVYNGRPPETSPEGLASLRQCELDCNEEFMSLKRVDEHLIGNERTLFASTKAMT